MQMAIYYDEFTDINIFRVPASEFQRLVELHPESEVKETESQLTLGFTIGNVGFTIFSPK